MTQEDKILLLKDLCARLPYMPKIKITYQQQGIRGTDEGNVSCDAIEHIVNDLRNGVITDMQIYLRPMSSMTEDERKEYNKTRIAKFRKAGPGYRYDGWWEYYDTIASFDYLNSIHIDYRGLILKGLAIAVTEENNPYKE